MSAAAPIALYAIVDPPVWLSKLGAVPGDFLIDRREEETRFVILRPLPAGVPTDEAVAGALSCGRLSNAAHLSAVNESTPMLQLVR